MPNSEFSSLLNVLDPRAVNEIAAHLDEPRQAVSGGLELTTASLINSLAVRSNDPSSLSQIFHLVTHAPLDVNVSDLASAATGSSGVSSPMLTLLESGNKFVSLVFGSNRSSILDAISRSAGLRRSSVTNMAGMVAALLMSELRRLVDRDQLSQAQLRSLLINERNGIQNLLPTCIPEPLSGRATITPDLSAKPLSITTEPEEPPSLPWLWIFPLLLLAAVLFWILNRDSVRQALQATHALTERANEDAAAISEFVTRKLPGSVDLRVRKMGVESRLLTFIQDPSKNVRDATWFDFDRLTFNTNSAQLDPESQAQLENIAAILKAYPDVHIKLGAYTDNTGDPESNLTLSQDRADSVVAELIRLGVQPQCLEAQGYGDQHPVADNSTEEGRARNRRISVRVTQK